MSIEELRQRQENSKLADNFKMYIIVLLVLSMFVFSVMGKDNVKPIIMYWAGFMSSQLVIALVLHLIARRKNKALGKNRAQKTY